jgi:hypothetical protein
MDVRLLSEPKGTIVVAECKGVRERASDERVHLRETQETCCRVCFAAAPHVWTDSEELHARHVARCEQGGAR